MAEYLLEILGVLLVKKLGAGCEETRGFWRRGAHVYL